MGQMGSDTTALKVLVVEDNRLDAQLLCEGLRNVPDWPLHIDVVDDGQKALHYLKRTGSEDDASVPDLILLDLNLPKHDGTEILQALQTQQNEWSGKVFVFSSSPSDVTESKIRNANLEADAYFSKPIDVDEFFALGRAIQRSYQSLNENPKDD